MVRARLWIWVLLIIVTAAGLIEAAGRQMWGLRLNGEVKTIEVLTLAVNLTIAWALQNFLASRTTNQRAEKDFIIGVVKDAHSRMRECNEKFYQCLAKGRVLKPDFDFLKASCRNLSNALEQIDVTIEKSQLTHLCSKCEGLKKTFSELKSVLTNTAPSRAFPPEASGDHAKINRTLYAELQDLVMKINKS
jgi:hypothetical protein